jgi:hypothetical protein
MKDYKLKRRDLRDSHVVYYESMKRKLIYTGLVVELEHLIL